MLSQLETKVLQVVFFVNSLDLTDRLTVAQSINSSLGGIFDGNPTILPIPDDSPLDFPRIILNSNDGVFSCNVSPIRIDFIFNTSKLTSSSRIKKDFEEGLLSIIADLSTVILNKLDGNIYRLALISEYKLSLKSGATAFLKGKISADFAKNAKELQIHKLENIELSGFKTNHWLRFISINGGTSNEFLRILSDMNTLQSEKYKITSKNSVAFFKSAFKFKLSKVREYLPAQIKV